MTLYIIAGNATMDPNNEIAMTVDSVKFLNDVEIPYPIFVSMSFPIKNPTKKLMLMRIETIPAMTMDSNKWLRMKFRTGERMPIIMNIRRKILIFVSYLSILFFHFVCAMYCAAINGMITSLAMVRLMSNGLTSITCRANINTMTGKVRGLNTFEIVVITSGRLVFPPKISVRKTTDMPDDTADAIINPRYKSAVNKGLIMSTKIGESKWIMSSAIIVF